MQSLTGLKVQQFEELHQKFDAELNCRKLPSKSDCKRAIGGSRKHTLQGSAGMLFFILLYLRIYPTMAVAAFLFGVARSNLTQAQRRKNRKKASSRVRIEHLIGLCKRYRCVSDISRNRHKNFDDAIMLICCRWTNFYQRTAKKD